MINFADSKANIFITIQSLLITIGIAGTLISDTFNLLQSHLKSFWAILYLILLFAFIITSLVGNIFAIIVFKPRGPEEEEEQERKGLFYYEHVAAFENSADYTEKAKGIELEDIFNEFCCQNYQLAKIAKIKMDYVEKAAIWLYINIIGTIVVLSYTVILHVAWGG
jgi:hypothetical protein